MKIIKVFIKPKKKPVVINEKLSLYINDIQNILNPKTLTLLKKNKKIEDIIEKYSISSSSFSNEEENFFENTNKEIRKKIHKTLFYIKKQYICEKAFPFENKGEERSESTCRNSHNSLRNHKPSIKELELRAAQRKENIAKIQQK